MKYQLPSDPNLYVDVVDDEDVAMMLDEWREACEKAPPGASLGRLHIFVQVLTLVPLLLSWSPGLHSRLGRLRLFTSSDDQGVHVSKPARYVAGTLWRNAF